MIALASIADQLEAAGVDIEHYFGGGAYIKETRIPAGARLAQHGHDHAHLSYLVHGTVVLTVDDEPGRRMWGPCCLVLEAGKRHGVQAVTDAVWLCCWATDCTDPATVNDVLTGRAAG